MKIRIFYIPYFIKTFKNKLFKSNEFAFDFSPTGRNPADK